MKEVTKDKFFEVIGPIEKSQHRATGKFVRGGGWEDSWELKTRYGELVGRSVEDKFYINEKYLTLDVAEIERRMPNDKG